MAQQAKPTHEGPHNEGWKFKSLPEEAILHRREWSRCQKHETLGAGKKGQEGGASLVSEKSGEPDPSNPAEFYFWESSVFLTGCPVSPSSHLLHSLI